MLSKRILLKPSSGNLFLKNNIYRDIATCNPFYNFDKLLEKKSIQIDTFDMKKKRERIDIVLCANLPYPWQFFVWWFLLTVKCKKKVLLVLESPIIVPHNHYKFLHWFFDIVYTWNDNQVDGNKRKKLSISYNDLAIKIEEKKFDAKKLLVFVNSNKWSPWLFHVLGPSKKNLYFERIKIANFFKNTISDQFDLYGLGWDKNNYIRQKFHKVYKGQLTFTEKLQTLSNYKFCICLENSVADGYISEKIYDCFKAKCVPIYFGAPNIARYIPSSAFIDFRDFENYEDLYHFIINMNEKTHKKYVQMGQEFMNSAAMKEKVLNKNLLKIITELVHS